jgi:hypothetical protein
MREFGRVPVGEADAAVRLGLSDRFRVRRAVDAVYPPLMSGSEDL